MNFLNKMKFKEKSPVKSPINTTSSPTQNSSNQISTQQWLLIKDIKNDNLVKKNSIIAVAKIEPINMNLLSDNEKEARIDALTEALNTMSFDYQFIMFERPVDLQAYIDELIERKKNEEDAIKIMILDDKIQQAVYKQTSGEITDRLFFLLIEKKITNQKVVQVEKDLVYLMNEVSNSITNSGLLTQQIDEIELKQILFIYFNPRQSLYEQTPLDFEYAPVLKRIGE